MGVSHQRASQVVIPLESLNLVVRPAETGGRLALTDRALALLAHRDRTSLSMAKGRWSAAPLFPGAPFHWTNVSGRQSRQLLRNLEHTAAVHAFLAAMTTQAALLQWEVVQLDPPRRASRYFRHGDRMRAVNPDAFGVLRKGGVTWPFFLEWERRAVRPSTMSARLAPYLRYSSSHRPTDDHGVRPAVLVVLDDDIARTHFLRLAREEMQATGVTVPLWVSHQAAVQELGPLGRAWRTPRRPGVAPGPPAPMNQLGRESHVFTTHQQAERPPEARRTDRGPARRGGPLRAAQPVGPLQNWLARQVGVTPAYMSMLVNGGRSPSGRIRRRMQKALGVTRSHQLSRRRTSMNNHSDPNPSEGRHGPPPDGTEPMETGVLPDDFGRRLERLKEASGLSWRGLPGPWAWTPSGWATGARASSPAAALCTPSTASHPGCPAGRRSSWVRTTG